MKVELEIISDRLPTEADGKFVLIWHQTIWTALHHKEVRADDIWMRQPPPPKPTIDKSLGVPGCIINHLDDNGEGPCVKPLPEVFHADTDGVGEGWEECHPRYAEECWNNVAGKWLPGAHYGGRNRRRI